MFKISVTGGIKNCFVVSLCYKRFHLLNIFSFSTPNSHASNIGRVQIPLHRRISDTRHDFVLSGTFDSFTGATITPRAVVNAVYSALQYFEENRAQLLQLEQEPVNG